MDPSVAARLLAVVENDTEVQDIDLPHILLLIDRVTWRATARGPYLDGREAARAAVSLKAELDEIGDDQPGIDVIPIPVTVVMAEAMAKLGAAAT